MDTRTALKLARLRAIVIGTRLPEQTRAELLALIDSVQDFASYVAAREAAQAVTWHAIGQLDARTLEQR